MAEKTYLVTVYRTRKVYEKAYLCIHAENKDAVHSKVASLMISDADKVDNSYPYVYYWEEDKDNSASGYTTEIVECP